MATAVFDSDVSKAADVISGSSLAGLRLRIAQAIAEERERCAKVAEHLNGWGSKPNAELAHHIAKVIRAS